MDEVVVYCGRCRRPASVATNELPPGWAVYQVDSYDGGPIGEPVCGHCLTAAEAEIAKASPDRWILDSALYGSEQT